MAAELLEVQGLRVSFGSDAGLVEVLDGVDLTVRRGEVMGLVGGKTTLARAILGVLPVPAARVGAGVIRFAGEVLLGKNARAMSESIRGRRITFIPQDPYDSFNALFTVGSQIRDLMKWKSPARSDRDAAGRWLPALLRRYPRGRAREDRQRVLDLLRLVHIPRPEAALSKLPHEFSGGQRQRLMIAMALLPEPDLIIADEPTTALDVTIQAQILSLLRRLQEELGMAVLLITHDLGVVANMAEEVVVVYHGRVMERGPLRELYARPRHPYLQALMRAVPRIGMAAGERLTPIREVERAPGGHLGGREPWPEGAGAAGPLLALDGVSKRFTVRKGSLFSRAPALGVQALSDVTLHIERGECLGLVGESGCGKTTLSKVIMRAVRPDRGSVHFNDRGTRVDLLALEGDALRAMRRRIQLVFQDPFGSLNPRMTVFDIVSEPLVIHGMQDRDERRRVVIELMGHVGLDPRFLSRYPHSFSGGQRQRIGIARALALNPELLICDEPVSALDVSVQAQVLNLLRELKEEMGLTYLFVSHNLAVVDYMADRIAVMCAGHLVEVAPREVLFREPAHPYTRALLAAVPRADPDRRLDLGALMEGRVSQPEAWPAPFTIAGGEVPAMRTVGEGHLVRATGALTGEAVA